MALGITFWSCMGTTFGDYVAATSGGQCATKYHTQYKVPHTNYVFLKMISEVVMSYYLLSRYLHAYVEPFDMCGLSFEISLCGQSSIGDLGSLCDM